MVILVDLRRVAQSAKGLRADCLTHRHHIIISGARKMLNQLISDGDLVTFLTYDPYIHLS